MKNTGIDKICATLPILALAFFLASCTKADAPSPPVAKVGAMATAAATVAPPAPSPHSVPMLSLQGYGPVRFGMTQSAARQAAQASQAPSEPRDVACSSVRFASLPGVRFMLEQDIVTRADAEPGVANDLGIAVGDQVANVRLQYPALRVTPHKYVPAGHYLTFDSDDQRAAVIMEDDGNEITRIRAGLMPAVAYVEGCL